VRVCIDCSKLDSRVRNDWESDIVIIVIIVVVVIAVVVVIIAVLSLWTISLSISIVVTDASLIVISGVDGIGSLPLDRCALRLAGIISLSEVGNGITVASRRECASEISACQSILCFSRKLKEDEELFVVVDSMLTSRIFKVSATLMSTINDVSSHTEIWSKSCSIVRSCWFHKSSRSVVTGWLWTLRSHVEPKGRCEHSKGIFMNLVWVLKKVHSAVICTFDEHFREGSVIVVP